MLQRQQLLYSHILPSTSDVSAASAASYSGLPPDTAHEAAHQAVHTLGSTSGSTSAPFSSTSTMDTRLTKETHLAVHLVATVPAFGVDI
jgi:hypothetical protein